MLCYCCHDSRPENLVDLLGILADLLPAPSSGNLVVVQDSVGTREDLLAHLVLLVH